MLCPGRLWSFLCKNSCTYPFIVASPMPIALSSDVSRYFKPATIPHERPCFHSLSVELYPVRWSQRAFEVSLSSVIAIELRERRPRQACHFQDKARHLANSASIGACRRPTLGLGPMSVSPHSCSLAVCAGSATSCRSLLDSAVSKRLAPVPGARRLTAGLSEFGDSDLLFSRSATQQVWSSATRDQAL